MGFLKNWLPVLVRPEIILYQEWTASFTDSPVSMMTLRGTGRGTDHGRPWCTGNL